MSADLTWRQRLCRTAVGYLTCFRCFTHLFNALLGSFFRQYKSGALQVKQAIDAGNLVEKLKDIELGAFLDMRCHELVYLGRNAPHRDAVTGEHAGTRPGALLVGMCKCLNSVMSDPSEVVDQAHALQLRDQSVGRFQLGLQCVDERGSLVGIDALQIDETTLQQSCVGIQRVVRL
jgi:hypothetical protein